MTETAHPAGTLSVPAAAARLGISDSHAYNLIRDNRFPVPVIRLGAITRIPAAALDRLLDGRAAGAA